MALPKLSFSLVVLFLLCCTHNVVLLVEAQVGGSSLELMTTDSIVWPTAGTSSMDSYPFGAEEHDEGEGFGGESSDDLKKRRALYIWHRIHYYISYAALSANRIPCPPRSGRSYYTHNCYRARGPVHPYTRGCSAITRCRSIWALPIFSDDCRDCRNQI